MKLLVQLWIAQDRCWIYYLIIKIRPYFNETKFIIYSEVLELYWNKSKNKYVLLKIGEEYKYKIRIVRKISCTRILRKVQYKLINKINKSDNYLNKEVYELIS